MRRIWYPLGYLILRGGQILRVKLNLRSNARGLSKPTGPAVIRWGGSGPRDRRVPAGALPRSCG